MCSQAVGWKAAQVTPPGFGRRGSGAGTINRPPLRGFRPGRISQADRAHEKMWVKTRLNLGLFSGVPPGQGQERGRTRKKASRRRLAFVKSELGGSYTCGGGVSR